MRVVVTGGTGNVGTAVVRKLLDDDQVTRVTGLSRRAPPFSLPGLDWVERDVTVDDLRADFAGAEVVVHLAWQFQPTHRPLVTWRENAVGSRRVFQAVVDAGVPSLVYASSVGAYSSSRGGFVDESWPTDGLPTAGYGREKAYVERALDTLEARHRDLRVVRMRPAFIFQEPAASEQRRIFAGPFLPGRALQPGLLPRLPYPRGLRFQALHADDAAEAYRLAVVGDAHGAFNLAADPVVDGTLIADLLDTELLEVSPSLVRPLVAVLWHARVVPADAALFDLVMRVPLLDTTRARDELGWAPTRSATDALHELLAGIRGGAGGSTPPLHPTDPMSRVREVVEALRQ